MKIFGYEPLVQAIAVLAASSFAIETHKFVVDKGIDDLAAYALVLPLAALVHFSIEFALTSLPLHIGWVRRLVSRSASIEGYWFEGVHSSAYPLSVVCIEYVPATRSYSYHGINYRADFSRNASFRSIHSSIDAEGSGMTFHYEASVHDWTTNHTPDGTSAARGYGKIRFFSEGSSSLVRGAGEFFERSPEPNWRTFELYRIPTKTVKKILKKKHAADDLDYDLLMEACIKARQYKNSSSGMPETGLPIGLNGEQSNDTAIAEGSPAEPVVIPAANPADRADG